jgi:hypothetical protein
VLVARVHVDRVRRQRAVVGQRVPVERAAALEDPGPEGRALGDLGLLGRPVAAAGKHAPQVVGDAAGAQHQHAFGRQRRQRLAERKQLGRAGARRPGQWQHRHVGSRIDVAQHGPDPMVEAALLGAMRAHQRGHALGQRGRAGRVVAQRRQTRVEAAEVVDRFVGRGRQQHRRARQGMGRQREDRARTAEAGVEGRPQALQECASGTGLEGDHRRAVGDEQGRQGVHGLD